jgi:YD repeat-containing protein
MSFPTKILLYDLDADIQQIINDLKDIQGSYATLKERLQNINSDLFDPDTKAVIEDLIAALNSTNKHISERMEAIELASEEGNYNESFTYDPDGNVTTHTATGDKNFTVSYNYKPDGSGELTYSEKTYTRSNGDQVTIRKDYTYDANGNITNIQTTTTVITP